MLSVCGKIQVQKVYSNTLLGGVCVPHLHGNGIDAVCVFELQTNVKNLSTRHDFTHNMLFTMSVLTDTHERALTGKQMELDIGKMHLLPQKKL